MLLTDLQLAADWSTPAYHGLPERRSSDDSGQVACFRMILRARWECRQENKDGSHLLSLLSKNGLTRVVPVWGGLIQGHACTNVRGGDK
jgi:hypothetical protein